MRNSSNLPGLDDRGQQGFSLIEVMIALVLLLIGMTGVGLAQLYSLRSASTSAVRSRALYLAEEQLETFQALSSGHVMLIAGQDDDANNPLPADPNNNQDVTEYYRCWVITDNTPVVGLKTITVEVRVGDPACNATQNPPPFGTARVTGVR